MLRRVDTASVHFQPGVFGKGPVHLVVGRRSVQLGKKKWSRAEMTQWQTFQETWPAFLAMLDNRAYWRYRDRIYSENEGLNQEQVHALLVSRDQREQRRVERAVAMLQQGRQQAPPARGVIPDDVKQYVWQRDGGKCRHCGSEVELQFDHVIPVAMGGSSEPENLQVLCGPCNRRKGAGLTL